MQIEEGTGLHPKKLAMMTAIAESSNLKERSAIPGIEYQPSSMTGLYYVSASLMSPIKK